jgi:hypothetical protein
VAGPWLCRPHSRVVIILGATCLCCLSGICRIVATVGAAYTGAVAVIGGSNRKKVSLRYDW